MRVAIPHNLPRDEVRRRMRDNIGDLASHIPGGMAEVRHSWPGEDRMALAVAMMGQTIAGHIDVEDRQVVVDLDLPGFLSFMEPAVQAAVRQRGQTMLEDKREGDG